MSSNHQTKTTTFNNSLLNNPEVNMQSELEKSIIAQKMYSWANICKEKDIPLADVVHRFEQRCGETDIFTPEQVVTIRERIEQIYHETNRTDVAVGAGAAVAAGTVSLLLGGGGIATAISMVAGAVAGVSARRAGHKVAELNFDRRLNKARNKAAKAIVQAADAANLGVSE